MSSWRRLQSGNGSGVAESAIFLAARAESLMISHGTLFALTM
jgi:hypothetical protein